MIIVSKRNIVIPSDDGKTSYFVPRDYIGKIPDWVTKTRYYGELVKDGKIVVSDTVKDKDVTAAEEKSVTDHAQEKAAEDVAEDVAEQEEKTEKRTRKKAE